MSRPLRRASALGSLSFAPCPGAVGWQTFSARGKSTVVRLQFNGGVGIRLFEGEGSNLYPFRESS